MDFGVKFLLFTLVISVSSQSFEFKLTQQEYRSHLYQVDKIVTECLGPPKSCSLNNGTKTFKELNIFNGGPRNWSFCECSAVKRTVLREQIQNKTLTHIQFIRRATANTYAFMFVEKYERVRRQRFCMRVSRGINIFTDLLRCLRLPNRQRTMVRHLANSYDQIFIPMRRNCNSRRQRCKCEDNSTQTIHLTNITSIYQCKPSKCFCTRRGRRRTYDFPTFEQLVTATVKGVFGKIAKVQDQVGHFYNFIANPFSYGNGTVEILDRKMPEPEIRTTPAPITINGENTPAPGTANTNFV